MLTVTLLPDNRVLQAQPGQTLHSVLAREGLLDAPCGGQGKCGKCRVLLEGKEVLACKTVLTGDVTVTVPERTSSVCYALPGTRIAFDIGTTGVVCCLVDGAGNVLSQASQTNPQRSYGADVVSRIRSARAGYGGELTGLIRKAMNGLLCAVCATPEQVEIISVVGNPAMQQLFLGLPVDNLAAPPFESVLRQAQVTPCGDIFPCCPKAKLLTVPDVSGFVGADTLAAVLSCGLHEAQALTLLVDIGTNGELVLGSKARMVACATAAGPALEGANIRFGMRAEPGAIHRVWVQSGALRCSVIGQTEPVGICGSGLIDAVAAVMDLGYLDRRGRIQNPDRKVMLTDKLFLTQDDIRQVQLAKGAVRAGIDLLTEALGVRLEDIQKVVLAGAFGSALNPESACRIDLLPKSLLHKVSAVGNAAGAGAAMLAADPKKLETAQKIRNQAELLELAALPTFPRTFAKAMELPPDWCAAAKKLGFTQAVEFDPAILQPRADVRAMCAQDKCRAYGKNWTCPPHCGSIEACAERIRGCKKGILLQTVGHLRKSIDTRGYRETEQRHLQSFSRFCDAIRIQYPDALCLGSGGCRICPECAYPAPCRFPERAAPSMEGYGLFVTQVCRDAGAAYSHGEKTITYTACVLYG